MWRLCDANGTTRCFGRAAKGGHTDGPLHGWLLRGDRNGFGCSHRWSLREARTLTPNLSRS